MGGNEKAVASFLIVMMDLPDNVKILLTYWVQQIPNFLLLPDMVQAASLFIAVKLPVALAVAWVTWRVKNTVTTQFGTLERPAARPTLVEP